MGLTLVECVILQHGRLALLISSRSRSHETSADGVVSALDVLDRASSSPAGQVDKLGPFVARVGVSVCDDEEAKVVLAQEGEEVARFCLRPVGV
jgi:hypothetical protein